MLDIKDYNYKRESHPCQGSSFIPDWETLLTLIFAGHGWHSFVKLHKYNESGFISSVSKIVTFIQYHLKQGTREGNGGEVMREKRRKWAREESESYVLRGRVSFTRRGEQGQTPECPSPLSWVTKAGTLPGIPCHHCHGDPHVPTAPAAGDGALGSGLISGITGRGTHAHLGGPLLLTVHRPPQPWNRKCSNGVQRRGGEGLWVQENHSRGSPHPVMYHRCPSLLRSLLWPFRSRVHALGENPPAGMVHGLCWRHIWESLLLLISAEGAQLRGSLDHTDDQGALQWCQNLFTLSETSAKLTVQLGIDLPWTSTYLRNQLILWNLFKIWQFSKNKSLTGWVSCPRSK